MSERKADKQAPAPWQVPVAIEDVAETGRHFDLVADNDVRAAVARVVGLRDLPKLEANFDVTRHGADGLHVSGRMSATVGQNCVVTLEPLTNEVEEDIDLVFAPPPPPVERKAGEDEALEEASGTAATELERAGTAPRRCRRSRRAGDRIPHPRARSLSAQTGRGFRAATRR